MPKRPDRRRLLRLLGTTLVFVGSCFVIWVLVVWLWQDPFTDLYTTYQQHRLASRYEKQFKAYRLPRLRAAPPVKVAPKSPAASPVALEERRLALAARLYRRNLSEGAPLGRIKVPRLGLNAVLVAGTDHDSLTKGPGWERSTFLPGEGQLMYIAGHRTTYAAPFAHIDSLRPGDLVTIEVPYGTFTYEVRSHVIVPADDLAALRSHGHEVVALQACHPRFFATHRYIAYAVPVRVVPRAGRPYEIAGKRLLAASLR
jgi:sortase A